MIEKLKNVFLKNGDKTAYIVNNEKITYKELWDKSNSLAQYLKQQGDSSVIVYGNKNIEMLISFIACLIAERAYIPLDTYIPFERLKKIISTTNSELLINNCSCEVKINDIEIISLSDFYFFNKDYNYIEDDNSIAYIIFTSGSTGAPKGVPISKKNLLNFINWIRDLKPLKDRKNTKVLNQASFSFDLSVADLYYSLLNGHTLVSLDNEAQNDFVKMFSIIKSEKINVAVMTPTFMKLLLLDSDFKSENFPDFDTVYFCGERLDVPTVKKLYQRFPDINIINAYGPTEATSAVSAVVIEKEMLDMEILPVGDCSNLATEVEIIDEEIVLKGKSIFSGYIGGITGGYYRENNIDCYKTGDLGYISDDKLFCTGRKDNQLKFKGYRIELEDIEIT